MYNKFAIKKQGGISHGSNQFYTKPGRNTTVTKRQSTGALVEDTNVDIFKGCEIYANNADLSIIYVDVNGHYWPLVKK